jgi:hypothetical protein
MSIQLWSAKGDHWFVDKELDVNVGRAWQENGQWMVQVTDDHREIVRDLKDAIRVFFRVYRQRNVIMGPASAATAHQREASVFGT